jgi:hypothetical protein
VKRGRDLLSHREKPTSRCLLSPLDSTPNTEWKNIPLDCSLDRRSQLALLSGQSVSTIADRWDGWVYGTLVGTSGSGWFPESCLSRDSGSDRPAKRRRRQ